VCDALRANGTTHIFPPNLRSSAVHTEDGDSQYTNDTFFVSAGQLLCLVNGLWSLSNSCGHFVEFVLQGASAKLSRQLTLLTLRNHSIGWMAHIHIYLLASIVPPIMRT
jgi:hypothetical protein